MAQLTDPRGQVRRHRLLLAAGLESEELTVPVPEPMLWDTTTPNLYQLQAVLLDGSDDRSQPLDTLSAQFGMRTIATSSAGTSCSTARCCISVARWIRTTTPI